MVTSGNNGQSSYRCARSRLIVFAFLSLVRTWCFPCPPSLLSYITISRAPSQIGWILQVLGLNKVSRKRPNSQPSRDFYTIRDPFYFMLNDWRRHFRLVWCDSRVLNRDKKLDMMDQKRTRLFWNLNSVHSAANERQKFKVRAKKTASVWSVLDWNVIYIWRAEHDPAANV